MARRLQACVRGEDVLARLGGDEFAVVQCGAAQPMASRQLAQRLIDALSQPFDLAGMQAHIGASVGIAVAPFDGETPDALLVHADLALYRAKGEGRGVLRYFEPAMDESMQTRRVLESDLREALDRGQLDLEYQPLVAMADETVQGIEALLRWRHPVRGTVAPADFIPVAEETGLIVPIGRWVLARACTDARRGPAGLRVSVNISAVQFRRGALLADVADALAASGLSAGRLELEITESVMMRDPAHALAQLRQLRALGVRIALDDFGTGYSSLTTLHSFDFDRIKIDRSFAQEVDRRPEALSIVRAVAGLGRQLGIAPTIEGVETAEQLAVARREGCTEVQGHVYSRARPFGELLAVIGEIDARRAGSRQGGHARV